MRIVIQRVTEASVSIESEVHAAINHGLLVLVGIESNDTQEDIDWLVKKTLTLRIFNDNQGKMNLSLNEVHGEILVVSQFTLFASCKKGTRPSFVRSANPQKAIPLYENFIKSLRAQASAPIKTGVFGANMKVKLMNDGPVTILLDSKNKE